MTEPTIITPPDAPPWSGTYNPWYYENASWWARVRPIRPRPYVLVVYGDGTPTEPPEPDPALASLMANQSKLVNRLSWRASDHESISPQEPLVNRLSWRK